MNFPLSGTDAAHLHILLNHLPIIGLAFGAIALALALWAKSRAGKTSRYFSF